MGAGINISCTITGARPKCDIFGIRRAAAKQCGARIKARVSGSARITRHKLTPGTENNCSHSRGAYCTVALSSIPSNFTIAPVAIISSSSQSRERVKLFPHLDINPSSCIFFLPPRPSVRLNYRVAFPLHPHTAELVHLAL